MKRKAVVAGRFYPESRDELYLSLSSFCDLNARKKDAAAIISPHAGIVYSGAVAGAVYSSVRIPDRVIILGPNHTGLGGVISIDTATSWETPLGDVEVDEEMCKTILKKSDHITSDALSHLNEHSLELQVIFLKYFNKNVKITPVVVRGEYRNYDDFMSTYMKVAKTLSDVTSNLDVLLVASSDMTHFETEESAIVRDKLAIDKIVDMDPYGLYNTVKLEGISMCGVVPVTMALEYCRKKGKQSVEITKYSTSGEVSGDFSSVVGYLGATIGD